MTFVTLIFQGYSVQNQEENLIQSAVCTMQTKCDFFGKITAMNMYSFSEIVCLF